MSFYTSYGSAADLQGKSPQCRATGLVAPRAGSTTAARPGDLFYLRPVVRPGLRGWSAFGTGRSSVDGRHYWPGRNLRSALLGLPRAHPEPDVVVAIRRVVVVAVGRAQVVVVVVPTPAADHAGASPRSLRCPRSDTLPCVQRCKPRGPRSGRRILLRPPSHHPAEFVESAGTVEVMLRRDQPQVLR